MRAPGDKAAHGGEVDSVSALAHPGKGSQSNGSGTAPVQDASEGRGLPEARLRADAILSRLAVGVVVVDAGGAVLDRNAAADELLGGTRAERCHDLFACRATGGPCEHGCLAARAAIAPVALPEIRIDTALDAGPSAVWVTAAALVAGESALLHLRAGETGDRRRRSDPHWLSGPRLRVRVLGQTRVESEEGPLEGRWLHQRPGQVLKYLVCQRARPVPAEEIAEALWPERGNGVSNVRYCMHVLRGHLEPGRPKGSTSSFVLTQGGAYVLDERRIEVDADEFDAAAAEGLAAAEAGDTARARHRLEAALGQYAGDFLEDVPYGEWAEGERDRLRELAHRGLRVLTRLSLAERDLPAAARHLERLAELEPYDEAVHRKLLEVWMVQGRASQAARRYKAFEGRLWRDLRRAPGFTLEDVGRRRRAADGKPPEAG
ncbi:MAG: hypothetical protein QOI91_2776 [Solirubrobacteraceae bacterium]|jgi:DNA-binding SARP family transcriptional activator|nr:hypothetical protein [Solirubrobacteraceae bacterium]